jgi:hypothetical protein
MFKCLKNTVVSPIMKAQFSKMGHVKKYVKELNLKRQKITATSVLFLYENN